MAHPEFRIPSKLAQHMDPDVDLSSLTPSTTQDSIDAESKKRRKGSAVETWAHARPPKDGEPERQGKNRIFYCKYCTDPPYHAVASNSFRAHLKNEHEIEVQSRPSPIQSATLDQLQQLYIRAMSTGQTQQLDVQVLRRALDRNLINEALLSLIVARNLPFRVVEWPEFHAFCRVLNPEVEAYITTAHSEVAKKIGQLWQSQQDIVRKKVQSALSSIHLSLDIWTSPNRLLLLGVCAHFVDRSREKHSKALLALREVMNHSGDEQFATLLPVLQDYGIVRRLGAIVCDNASSNDTLCRAIGIHLREKEGIEWNSTYRRIRCTGHAIHLSVESTLFRDLIKMDQLEFYDAQEERGEAGDEGEKRRTFRVMGPLGKLHNIVVHIRSSASRTREFKCLAGRMIPLDNRTRWNSWYQMLVVAEQKSGAIDTYSKNHLATLEADYLFPADWERLRTIKAFLQPFHRATLETQGDGATIDRVLFTMDILVQYFERALVGRRSY